MTTWQEDLDGGFGGMDNMFDVHPNEMKRAKAALKRAKDEGANEDDVIAAVKAIMAKRGVDDDDFIRKQASAAASAFFYVDP